MQIKVVALSTKILHKMFRFKKMAGGSQDIFCYSEGMKVLRTSLCGAAMLLSVILIILSAVLSARLISGSVRFHSSDGMHSSSGVLLFVQGVDPLKDLNSLRSQLYGADEDTARIAQGVLQSFLTERMGTGVSLMSLFGQFGQSPYAFLLKKGDEGSLTWVFAVQSQSSTEEVRLLLDQLQAGVKAHSSPAMVRTRTLPDGRVVRDVVHNPDLLHMEERSYRRYLVRSMHYGYPRQMWIDAHYNDAYLVSNNAQLLQETIDSGFLPAIRSIKITPEGFEHLRLLFPDSDMMRLIARLTAQKGDSKALQEEDIFCRSSVVLP